MVPFCKGRQFCIPLNLKPLLLALSLGEESRMLVAYGVSHSIVLAIKEGF